MLPFLPSFSDLFAIIFGILLTLRKLDVAHRQPSQHPNVSAKDFELWQATAMRAYGFGVWACFLKIVVDFIAQWVFSKLEPSLFLTAIGISFEVLWIAAMVATWRMVSRAHRLAERVGVEQPRNGGQSGLAAGSGGSPPAPPA